MINLRRLDSYEVFDYTVLQEETQPTLKEDVNGNRVEIPGEKKILLKGVMQKADTLNQNGRVYPKSILDREVRNYQKFINENRALGELDHPDSSVVNLKNASHIIREAYMDNGVVHGTIEVLDKTPSGAILKGLIDHKVKIGISSRGVGSTRKDGDYLVVQDDFQLITFDVVSEPSTSQAFMIPEGKQINSHELKQIFNRTDRIDRILNDILAMKVKK